MRTKNKKHNEIAYCKFCKKDITHKPSNRRNFCNYDCFSKWIRTNGSPSRKRIVIKCKLCKGDFESRPFEKRVFCSKECLNRWNSEDKKNGHFHTKETKEKIRAALKGRFTGKNNSFYVSSQDGKGRIGYNELKPKVERICPICNKIFLTEQWRKKKFCSLECVYKRPGQGGYHAGSVTNFKSGWYESPIAGKVWLDSSYEFIMAKYLDERKYQWTKNKIGFDYIWKDDKVHLYIPDFYVKDLDIWIETKGYMVEQDTWKWYFFPNELKVITKKKIFNPETWGF